MKKIKQSKNTKRTARRTDDGSIEDGLPRLSHSSTPRAPGQLENCAVCSNRFTVTAYTKASPDGGLMCTKCAKEVDQDLEKEKPKKKPAQNRDRRRQMRAELLDGIVRRGAKSLVELCIRVSGLGCLPVLSISATLRLVRFMKTERSLWTGASD